MGRACPPLLCFVRVRARGPVERPGQAEVELRCQELGPAWGPGLRCSLSAWLRGAAARGQGLDAV